MGGLLFALFHISDQGRELAISSFDECVAAGNPVMPARMTDDVQSGGESHPEQCRTADGRLFVNERQITPNDPGTVEDILLAGSCVRAGCSQQLCVDAGEASDIVTTCEYRAEYACYEAARCERQASGECGWTETTELRQCLGGPPPFDASVEGTI